MATQWPAYSAGSARITIRPQLSDDFRARLRAQLAPIKESLKVTVEPKLVAGFKTTLQNQVVAATQGVSGQVVFKPKLVSTFRSELSTAAKQAAASVRPQITVSPKLSNGFKSSLRSAAHTAAEGVTGQVVFKPRLAAGFRNELAAKARAVAETIRPHVEFEPKLAAGFKTAIRNKVSGATTGVGKVDLPVDVDLAAATTKLNTWRAAMTAVPLTFNVDVDTGSAVAQLMALRALAGSIGNTINGLGGSGGISGAARRLRGNIFTRPVRAIRLRIELDRASIAEAEADLARIRSRLSQDRQKVVDATDRLTLAERRYSEVMANSGASESRKIAATQALTRARRALADANSRVGSGMDDEHNARRNLDRTRERGSGIGRLIGAGLSGLGSAVGDMAKNMLSFSNVVNVALIGLVALAAVSLIPLIGQFIQAAGVVALLPAAFAGIAAVLAPVIIAVQGVGGAFSAAGKAADSAGEDMEARSKAVAAAQKQVASATKGVTSAQKGIVSAERGVRDAQKRSLDAQKNLTKAREDARKGIEDLNRSLRRTALDEEGAALSVAEAQRELWRTFMDPESDAIDRARAQHNVKQALADQQDTIYRSRELAEQAAEANRKGIEGSDQVVAAKEQVAAAAEAEGDAQDRLAEAHERLAEAQAELVEAQQEVTKAMTETSSAASEFDKAMAKLSPNAQDFVRRILEMRESFGALKRDLQDRFFDGLGESIQNLGNSWLPTLRTGLGGITTEINLGLRRAFADLSTEASRSKLADIFENVRLSIGPTLDGLNNLFQAFLSLAQVGSSFMPSGANSFLEMTERFRKWAESPEGQQKFKDFLRESLRTFNQLWNLGKKLVGLFRVIFSGSDETGEGWVESMANTFDRWTKFLESPEGQQKMKDFWEDVEDTVNAISTAISWIIKLIDKVETSPLGRLMDLGDEDKSAGEKAGGVGSAIWNTMPIVTGVKAADSVAEDTIGFSPLEHSVFSLPEKFGQVRTKVGEVAGGLKEDLSRFGVGLVSWATTTGTDIGSNIGGAFTGIRETAGNVGDWFSNNLVPTFGGVLGGFVTNMGTKLTEGGGFWGGFQGAVSGVIGQIIGPGVLGKLREKFDELPGFFKAIVAGISGNWGALAGHLTGPVNAVIGILNGFGDIWNKVADKLGLPKWDPLPEIGTPAPTGQPPSAGPEGPARSARWMGGAIEGGVRGRDSVPIMAMPGEHVWTTAEVAAAGGHQAMYRMRRSVLETGGRQSSPDGPVGKYAQGGIVSTSDPLDPVQLHLWDLVREAIPGAILTSAKRFADVGSGYDLHMQGKAIDLGGPMKQIARWIYDTYPQSAELIHWPLDGWQNLDEGQPFDFGPATNAQHADHVHWAANDFLTPMSEEERKGFMDRVKSGLGAIVSRGRSSFADMLSRPLMAAVDRVPDFSEFGQFGQIPKAFARKLADAMIAIVAGRAGSGGGSGPNADWQPGSGAEQWRQMMIDAYRNQGYEPTPEKIDAWVRQIHTESGGDPNIAQQIVDVNGTGEAAGVGLGQMIPSTWAAYRDPALPDNRRDPWAMTNAMVRYGERKYGDRLLDVIGRGHGYDQGGILKDKHWGFNLSGLPEAVLTNPQWKMFEQFINQMPGFNNRLQAIPQPGNGGTNADGTPGTFGVPTNPGVDTWESLGQKTQDRFSSALSTGFDDMLQSTLSPFGIRDPRSFPAVQAVTEYGTTLESWHQAKVAAAQAQAALAGSGYPDAVVTSPMGAAEAVTPGAGGVTNNDNSRVFNIYANDPADGLRQARMFDDLHSLTKTARS